jgi:NAD(P)-dependent dehydrogenase (short-subunit alcohol dehydrogenase family)
MRTALITGANRGIGLELATECKARGDRVIATCRQASDALNLLDVTVVEGIDVTDWDSLTRLSDALGDMSIDILICNAGILKRDALDDLSGDFIADLEAQFRVNAIGPLMTLCALKDNLYAGSKVAIITSRMGSIADNDSGGYYGYRMSKAAVNAAGMSLANDLRPQGVAVALIHPGWVQTDMGGESANVSPESSAKNIIARIEALDMDTSGSFWHADGQALPW